MSDKFATQDPTNPALCIMPINGDVTGTARLDNTITIEPSEWFKVLVKNLQTTVEMSMSGKLGTTIQGSNGTRLADPEG